MLEDIITDAESRMKKSVESLKTDLAKVRTGRAHPSLLDSIMVSYYNSDVPLTQVANVSVGDARTLNVSPWEKPMVPVIEKAIMTSSLGLNPVTSGDLIRVPLPALTEERRREFIKIVRTEGEAARVAIRNIRRDALSHAKDLLKEKKITEDQDRKAQDRMQKITDKQVAVVDELLKVKERELLEI